MDRSDAEHRSPGPPSPGDAALSGERMLIHHIRRRLPPGPASLLVGPGDDAAVILPARGALQVLSTDALVENVHFDRRFSSLRDIGYKAMAVNVSDLAAMGARPEFGLVSFIFPDAFTASDVDALLDGLLESALGVGLSIAGGNISRSPGPLVVDVTAIGSVRPRRVLTRGGGRAGDALYVTGSIGAAAAGLEWLTEGNRAVIAGDVMASCAARHRRPEPRVRIGQLLGRNRAASACMDLSDGLADGVRQIAEASGTGATIDAAALPVDPAAASWFRSQGRDPASAALAGGDDYELLFAVPRKFKGRLRHVEQKSRGVALTRVGELTAESGCRLTRDGSFEDLPAGFSHF